jgi:6-phosphofructokinase 1
MLAEELYNLLADAASSGAYYLAQVMGRQAAWLAYGAAIAGESSLVIGLEDIAPQWRRTENAVDPATGKEVLDAKTGKPLVRDVIDVPSLVSRIVDTIQARREEGKSYGVIVVAEGMAEYLPQAEIRECLSQSEYVAMKADEFGHFPVSQLKFSTRLGRLAAEELKRRTGEEQKIVGLQFGYEVRCKRPTAFDVILGSQIGVGAYRALAEKGLDGVMVSVGGPMRLSYEPFEKLIDLAHLRARARPITPGEDFHQLARYLEAWVAE